MKKLKHIQSPADREVGLHPIGMVRNDNHLTPKPHANQQVQANKSIVVYALPLGI
jgi:hypothetical protein